MLIGLETERSIQIGLECLIGDQLIAQIQHLAHVRVGHKFVHKNFDTNEAGHLKAVLDADAHEKRERPEQVLENGRDAKVSQIEHAEEPGDTGVHKGEEGREGDQVGEDGPARAHHATRAVRHRFEKVGRIP
jgi:hypothetical protein